LATKSEIDRFRVGKAYTLAQAAALAETSPQNVRRWIYGYSAPGHKMQPVFGDKSAPDVVAVVSFLELIEIAVVAAFRANRVSLQRLRDAHEYAREAFGLEYPFASLNLREQGGHVLHEFEEQQPGARLVVLDMQGQFVLPQTVHAKVIEFDFDEKDRLASRWFPFGRQVPVVIDPHFAAGIPVVKGTRVSVDTVTRRWKSGETISSIATDLELEQGDVEHILQRAA
jgi:uncharacterized protein (DUF433 family)